MIVSSFHRSEGPGETSGGGCAELMSGEDPTKDQSHPITAEDPSGERDRGKIKRELNRPQHLAGAEIGNFGPGIK